jgi:hypothetical protein
MAVVNLVTRQRVSWAFSNRLGKKLCLEAQEMPLSSGRKPLIFHTIFIE